ncbi:hypothetical protein NEMBOFW57_004412 [Staphylotrichum longicolle]|uniref:Uncharacterized protein n=1 Tax=Staphylotrichum longicolle TaxID=669026 RepID=A0AAD4F6S4_9PEZI|nr:hypothetical protein NEMBOFW57_004412 [Staphylotrichum longicolle]
MDSEKKKQAQKPARVAPAPLDLSTVSNQIDSSSATDSLPFTPHTRQLPAKSAPTTPGAPSDPALRPFAPVRADSSSVLNRNDELPKSKSTSHLLKSNRPRRHRKPKPPAEDGFTVESITHFGEAILKACKEQGKWATENTFASIPATPFEPDFTYEDAHKAFYAQVAREREDNEKRWASHAASRAASTAASRRASGQHSPSALQSRSHSWISGRSAPRTPFEKRAEARVALKFDDYFGVTQLGPNGEEDERLNSPDFIEKVGEQLEIMEAEQAAEDEETPEETLERITRNDPLLKLGRRIGRLLGYGQDLVDEEEEADEEDDEDEEEGQYSEAELARICEAQRREERQAARRTVIAPIPPELLREPAEHGGGFGDFVWFTTLAWRAILT